MTKRELALIASQIVNLPPSDERIDRLFVGSPASNNTRSSSSSTTSMR